jgi:MFS transporter, NNP family, nitrate/nitrite transporter
MDLRPLILLVVMGSLPTTLVGRLEMGPTCDLFDPRDASGFTNLLAALTVVIIAVTASSPVGFIVLRFVAGLSLANFVANQHWMSGIFAPSVIGLANAVTTG